MDLTFNKPYVQFVGFNASNNLLSIAYRHLQLDLRILIGKISKSCRQNIFTNSKTSADMYTPSDFVLKHMDFLTCFIEMSQYLFGVFIKNTAGFC
ncbi:hypothetical protein D3C76_1652610 [compost metagenome]